MTNYRHYGVRTPLNDLDQLMTLVRKIGQENEDLRRKVANLEIELDRAIDECAEWKEKHQRLINEQREQTKPTPQYVHSTPAV